MELRKETGFAVKGRDRRDRCQSRSQSRSQGVSDEPGAKCDATGTKLGAPAMVSRWNWYSETAAPTISTSQAYCDRDWDRDWDRGWDWSRRSLVKGSDLNEDHTFKLPQCSTEPLADHASMYYQNCKEYYRLTKKPLLIISKEIRDKAADNKPYTLKIGVDEDFETFDSQNFLRQLCKLLNLTPTTIAVTKIELGSVILQIQLEGKEMSIKLPPIIENLQGEIAEELGRFHAFLMFMGRNISELIDIEKMQKELKMNPQYNRIYDREHTYWNGVLRDGRDRGEYEYFCPIGWKRFSLNVTDNFDDKFKGWSIGYHGTKFKHGLAILLSGLATASTQAYGPGIYTTQSIIYAAHPRYSEVKKLEKSDKNNIFPGECYIQFVLQCRIRPSEMKAIRPETLGVKNSCRIDPNISNDVIEWVIGTDGKKLVYFDDQNANIVCTGVMVRCTDNHPGLLPESSWWFLSRLCNDPNCCALGLNLEQLKKEKQLVPSCNILYW